LLGATIGFCTCLLLGGSLVSTFYILGTDQWSDNEYLWEGIFGVISSAIITIMGVAMLRISKLQAKWRRKLLNSLEFRDERTGTLGQRFKAWCENHALFILPFVTILREGIEAIVFVGGVTIGMPASSVPLPTLLGLAAGSVIGYAIFKGGNMASLRVYLTLSTCFLYHIAAGLFSRAVWFFEADRWNKLTGGDAAENGSGPGSYDIRRSVWHVNCCNPQYNGGGLWGVFNSLLGWQNSATYGSVVSYNAYWIVVMAWFIWLRYKEMKVETQL
jgi:high-affinity iron transporter